MTNQERGDMSPEIEDLVNAYPKLGRERIQTWEGMHILWEVFGILLNNLPKNGRYFGTGGELFGDGGLTTSPEVQSQRAVSEHKGAMDEKLKRLLRHSPTTQSYKDLVVELYDELYIKGLQTALPWAEPALEQFYNITGFHGLDVGLFDPKTTKDLERKAFNLVLRRIANPRNPFATFDSPVRSFWENLLLQQSKYETLEEPQDDIEQRRKRYFEAIPVWREQFSHLYGEDLIES